MYNTHEWTADGVEGFKEQLMGLEYDDFPLISDSVLMKKNFLILEIGSVESELEKVEMERESIKALAIAPLLDCWKQMSRMRSGQPLESWKSIFARKDTSGLWKN